MSQVKVDVQHLTKRFKIYRRALDRAIEWLSGGLANRHAMFTALDDISFQVRNGEFFGIIGPNGSGKSTLLKILTGVMWPTSGTYTIHGRVTSLLELGTGFNPELTGRENILNSARLLGFTDEYVRSRLDAMIEFADIGRYIDQPIKYYSSGMLVRLAFSIFSNVEPDVFIVDEALSVGDVHFSQKCFQRLDQMRASGCTLLFVSHDLTAMRKYCDQVLYLHAGQPRFLGPAVEATDMYLEAMSPGGAQRELAPQYDGRHGAVVEPQKLQAEAAAYRAELPAPLAELFDERAFEAALSFGRARIGTSEVRIVAYYIGDATGRRHERYAMNETIHAHVLAEVRADIERATVSIQVTNHMGIVVWGTNHARLTGEVTPLRNGTWSHTHFVIEPGLGPGEYTVDFGYGDAGGEGHVFDRLTAAARIEIAPEGAHDFMGIARIPCRSDVREYRRASANAPNDNATVR